MKECSLGIDPGIKGAFVVLNELGDIDKYYPMPKAENEALGEYVPLTEVIDIIKEIVQEYPGISATLEKVSPFAKGSKKSAFGFGINYSSVVQALELLSDTICYKVVNPYQNGWQTFLWKPEDYVYKIAKINKKKERLTKETTYNALARIFPKKDLHEAINYRMTNKGKILFNDGVLDAIGIAYYMQNQSKEEQI